MVRVVEGDQGELEERPEARPERGLPTTFQARVGGEIARGIASRAGPARRRGGAGAGPEVSPRAPGAGIAARLARGEGHRALGGGSQARSRDTGAGDLSRGLVEGAPA